MTNYYKIKIDSKNRKLYAVKCYRGGFIGIDYDNTTDLTKYLVDDWNHFSTKFTPIYRTLNPGMSKVAVELALKALWSYSKEIQIGDIVVCPNGRGVLHFGKVISNYFYHPDGILTHRRAVEWFPATIKLNKTSKEFRVSWNLKSPSMVITQHAEEIEKYIREYVPPTMKPNSEKHLEDFLVENWEHTTLGEKYDIYKKNGKIIGRQFRTETGPIDILAISKDKKQWLVVELKKGKANVSVVGQIQAYMGYVEKELAKKNQLVKGIIIASEDNQRIRNALRLNKNIEFFRYRINFELY